MTLSPGAKGTRLEELLRAYFLRAGFFVVRGVPFQHAGGDLTDIDLWLYERPTGSTRRRQIVDAKSKTKPKAVERLLWTKGLARLLDVDGAYVATTDTRPMLRKLSKKLGVSILDGADIKRINESDKVLYADRMPEEELLQHVNSVDRARRTKDFELQYHDIKLSLVDNFGAGTINRALEAFSALVNTAITAHPKTPAAGVALRLSYFAAAIVALALDYIGAEVAFRASEERLIALTNAIRYGNIDEAAGLERMRLATALIRKYSPSGEATARTVELAIKSDLNKVPAEIISEFVVKNTKSDELFQVARRLEHISMSRTLLPFDALGAAEKPFIAMLLDYSEVSRSQFASSWSVDDASKPGAESSNDGPLFSPTGSRGGREKA